MFPTQPWRERKGQVSGDSKAERKRRQKLARREREKRRKANDRADRDADAKEPEAPSSGDDVAPAAAPALESSPGTAAAPSAPSSGFEVEEDAAAPVRGSASSSSSRRVQELEYELDVRTRAAQADRLLLQRRLDDAELKFFTQKAMTADESTRRQKLEMAAAAQALKDKKELDRARLAQAELEDHAAAARTHLAYRETVLRDLQHKNRDLANRLQIEQDASRRSDRRLVAQVVEEKGKRIALELQLEKQQRNEKEELRA